jgi:hypothetical protein
LKKAGCWVARKRRQIERLKNARFASRGELCSTLGEVEKRHDGVIQQAASACGPLPTVCDNRYKQSRPWELSQIRARLRRCAPARWDEMT